MADVSHGIGNEVAGQIVQVAKALGMLKIAIGLAVFLPRPNLALLIGAILAVVIWLVGQDFGGILSGWGTDPNYGPWYVKLALVLSRPRQFVVSSREPGMKPGVNTPTIRRRCADTSNTHKHYSKIHVQEHYYEYQA